MQFHENHNCSKNMSMKYSIKVEKLHAQESSDEYVPDPDKALDILEELRLSAGKFYMNTQPDFEELIN